MIKSIQLQNFFSFGKEEPIELNPAQNILVGINGSGKSNFIKAIKLLYESAVGKGLEKLINEDWGGVMNVINSGKEETERTGLFIMLDKDFLNALSNAYSFEENLIYFIVIFKKSDNIFSANDVLCLNSPVLVPLSKIKNLVYYTEDSFTISNIKSNAGKGKYGRIKEKIPSNYITTETPLRQIASDSERHPPLYVLKQAISQIAVYEYFDTTLKSPIRQARAYSSDERLQPNGDNLTNILVRIKNNHGRFYDKIEEYLHKVNPHFKDIGFDVIGSRTLLTLREKELNKTVSIEHISDGTLRYLLLLAIFFNPKRGALVCIDEPETGLHPDMLRSIAEAIKEASKTSQIIIATHSPFLLNQFELEDVLVFDKNEKNQSVAKHFTEEDFPDWDDNSLVGQFWMSGKMGGTRW